MGPPLRTAEFNILFDSGIDDYGSWLQIMKDHKLKLLVDDQWAFHIRYNSDDNNLAIFDYWSFGMSLKKIKRRENVHR